MTIPRNPYESLESGVDPAQPWTPPPPPGGGFFARVGYVFAALLLASAVFGAINPVFGFHNELAGFDARIWPWELFTTPAGLVWTRETAWVLSLLGAAVVMLVCAFLRPSRVRARLALLTTAVVVTALLPNPLSESFLVPACVLVLLVGVLWAAAISVDRSPRPDSARRLAAIAVIATFVLLFLPLRVVRDEMGEALPGYYSTATGAIDAIANALGPNPHSVGKTPEGENIPATVWNVGRLFIPEIVWILALVVGALTALGAGRRWARFALAVLAVVLLLGPPAVFAWRTVDEERGTRPPDVSFDTRDVVLPAARGGTETLLRTERLALLPLALGLADLLRTSRRRSKAAPR